MIIIPDGHESPIDAGHRSDARGMQDLPHRGRRNGEAGLRQFAVDPAVSLQRILLRQPNGSSAVRVAARPGQKACDGNALPEGRHFYPCINTIVP